MTGASILAVLAGPLGLDPLPVAAAVIVLVAALRVLSVWRGWEAPVAVDLPARTRNRLGRRPQARRLTQPAGGGASRGGPGGDGSMYEGTSWGPASGGRGSPCGCSRTARMATSSSASGRNSRSSTRSQSSSSGRPGVLAEDRHQLGRPGVDVAVAALDQPVGVEQHRRAAGQADDPVLATHVRAHTQQQVGGSPSSSVTSPSASITTGGGWPALDQRNHVRPAGGPRRSPRAGPPARSPWCPARAPHGTVERGEDLGRGAAAGVADPAQQAAHLTHRGRGPGVVAGDVTDRQHGSAVVLEEGVVPVATDLGALGGRHVADDDRKWSGSGGAVSMLRWSASARSRCWP